MHDTPVSIIVLTYNNLADTQECFEALAETTSSYELVVVDNGSTDGTVEYLRSLELRGDTVLILNSENRGYGGGCNQGVARASHEMICLLNNDTVPREGWLDALRDVWADGIGAVGAKLLYPDGTIQHAGIVFNWLSDPEPHLHPEHRLRFAPDPPEANVLEDVPAVTGACLLTSKRVWNLVGGIDEITYTMAYFEDVDLCLNMRAAGLRIVYQPLAALVHKEQGTARLLKGTAGDPMQYFAGNQAGFSARWGEELLAGLADVSSENPPATREGTKPSNGERITTVCFLATSGRPRDVYRLLQPALWLARDADAHLSVHVASSLLDPAVAQSDVLFVRASADRATFDEIAAVHAGGTRLVVDFDEFTEPPHYHPRLQEFLRARPIPELLAGSATRVIAASQALARALGPIAPDVTVLPTLVEPPTYGFPQSSRESYGLPRDAVVIAYGADLNTNIGIRTLEGALPRLASEVPNVWFLLFCDATLPPNIPGDRVVALGRRSYAEYLSLLSLADVGIVPLEETTFDACRPATLALEYAAAGLGVVGTRWGAPAELEAEGAPFVLASTPEGWHLVLSRLALDAGFLDALKQACRRWAGQQTGHSSLMAGYRNVLDSIRRSIPEGRGGAGPLLRTEEEDGAHGRVE